MRDFLLKEILPEVRKDYKMTDDPEGRAICGIQRRHLRVHGRVGAARPVSQGAQPRRQLHEHSRRRRLSRPDPQERDSKPIRVFLQDGANDLDNQFGNWPLANQADGRGAQVPRLRLSASSSATAATTASTAGRFCPTRCAGCGGITSCRLK